MDKSYPLSGPDKRLKVFLPNISNVCRFLKNSCRFNICEFGTFNEIQIFLQKHFNFNFDILYIGKNEINDVDLERNDYIAFLPIEENTLRDELTKFTTIGIPIVFVKTHPEMECDCVKMGVKQNECFQFRSEGKHCKYLFFNNDILGTKLKFEDPHTIIRNMKNSPFNLETIPLFSVGFIIDFLIWYSTIGKILKHTRDNKIRLEIKMAKAVADHLAYQQ